MNVALDEISKNDLTVVNQDGEKQYVKSVEIVGAEAEVQTAAANNSTKLKVEFYNPLKSGDTYTFTVDVDGEKVSTELEFEIADAAVVELDNQAVKPSGYVKYKVLDENGLDITSLVKKDIEIETDDGNLFKLDDNGNIKVKEKSGSAFLKIKVTKDNKTLAESNRVKVTANAAKATTLGEYWSLSESEGVFDVAQYEDDKEKNQIVQVVNMGTDNKYINVSVTDQFGDDFESVDIKDLTFKSLDTDVAIVDASSGKVTPRNEGIAPVKVTYKKGNVELTKTIELEVVAKAKFADFKLDKNEVSLNSEVPGLGEDYVKVELLDQFGNEFTGEETVKAVSADEKVVSASVEDKKITLKAKKEGSTVVTVTVGDVEKQISVKVQKPGEIVDYVVEGFKEELLFDNVKSTDSNETEMTLKVKGIDAEGVPTKILSDGEDYSIEVTDAKGKVVGDDNDYGLSIGDSKISVDKEGVKADDYEGPFTVTVKVGGDNPLTVFQGEFTVKDNRVAPEFSISNNNLTFTSNVTKGAEFFAEFAKTFSLEDLSYASSKAEEGKYTIKAVEYVSSDEKIIKSNNGEDLDTYETGIDGKTTIYVDTVTVEVGKNQDVFKLDFNGEVYNVEVTATEEEGKSLIKNFEINVPTYKYKQKDKENGLIPDKFSVDNVVKVAEQVKINFDNSKDLSKIENLKVTAFIGDHKLATNTLIRDKYNLGSYIRTPFNFNQGAEDRLGKDYGSDWDRGGMDRGKTDFPESNILKDETYEPLIDKVIVEFNYKGVPVSLEVPKK